MSFVDAKSREASWHDPRVSVQFLSQNLYSLVALKVGRAHVPAREAERTHALDGAADAQG
jgi:hypothetical protein